jgi:tRNA (cmo5U34)-methyltransferase
METNDFSGIIGGKRYALVAELIPHFKEMQENIAYFATCKAVCTIGTYKVLEVGCGPGPTTDKLLQTRENVNVTAVDIEKQMIDEAKINLAKYGGRVNFVLEDMLKFLPTIKDNTYDSFASGWTLHNLNSTQRHQALSEIYRVLKPGALFVNGDKYAQDDVRKHKRDYKQFKDCLTKMDQKYGDAEWTKQWIEHYNFDEKPEIIMFENKAIEEMSQIGFVKVKNTFRRQMESIVVAYKPKKYMRE